MKPLRYYTDLKLLNIAIDTGKITSIGELQYAISRDCDDPLTLYLSGLTRLKDKIPMGEYTTEYLQVISLYMVFGEIGRKFFYHRFKRGKSTLADIGKELDHFRMGRKIILCFLCAGSAVLGYIYSSYLLQLL